ncbi:hypothetical protein MJT46_011781 [Ovis ammon polii x Ovis aries]|nr:hypothetical protein MJT46_011781 [Ovis ammon polii x Ovis aries]
MQETGGTPPGQRSLNQEQGSTNCTSGELCSRTNNQTGPLPAGAPFGVFTLSENRLTSRPSASQEEPANPQVPGRPHVLAKAVSPCSCRNCYPRRPSRPEAPWHATCQIPYPVAYLPPAWTHTGGLPHQKPASGLPRHFRIPEGKGQILTHAEIKKEHRPSLVTHRLIGTLIKLLKLEYIYPGYLHRKGACSDNGSAMKFCERQVSQNQLLPDVIKHGSKQQEGRPGYPNLRIVSWSGSPATSAPVSIPISKPGSGEPDLRERHAAVPGKFSSFRKPVSPRCVSPRCANPFSWDVRP